VVSKIELLSGRVSIDSRELLRHSRAQDEDVVVLSGTLLEGIGNLYSDLDLYVIGDQLPLKEPDAPVALVVREDGRVRRINETLESATRVLLDVQYYTFRELGTLARSMNELHAEARQSMRIFRKTLHPDDEDLIHKLLTGMTLQDSLKRFDAHRLFDAGKFCFLKYRNEVGGYAEFRDLIGSWTDGDLDSCLYNMRSYLVAQVSGMMFLAGNTNSRPKWFVRRLIALGDDYKELRERILSWIHSARNTAAQKREAIETACELIDMSYRHSRALLETNPQYVRVEEALTLAESELAGRAAHDLEAAEELQLLQRMFGSAVAPLATQLGGQARRRPELLRYTVLADEGAI
jgi:hypothetical protein